MKKLAYLFVLALIATSCQKVIDVDLNDGNQVVVLEANYSGEDSTVHVSVSLTSSYFNSEPPQNVDNALVTIVNQNGTVTNVPSVGNGEYVLTNYAPDYDTRYLISVAVNGETYNASCFMPTPVPLSPITSQFIDDFFGIGPGYVSLLNFQDPPNEVNFYQIVVTRNSITFDRIDEIQTQDDLFSDGNFVQRPLFFDTLSQIGDTISYEFRTVDQVIYDYTVEAASISGGTNSAAPGNPTTNWDNGALGYFNAFGVSRDTLVIQ